MAKKPRNDLIDRLQYVALRTVTMMVHCLPVETCLGGATLLGDLMYVIDAKHRKRAIGNLTRSFPEKSPEQIRHIARLSMRQFFMLGIEVLFTTRKVKLNTYASIVDLSDFRQTLELLLSRHKGLLMLTGHYGNWEILGYVLATLGFQTTSVARPLDNPYVNEWLLGVRERQGQRILAKTGAIAEIPGIMEAGGAVGLIADQNAGSKGMFVEFFGRQASTYKSIGLLAMRYHVPVIVGYARRHNGKFRFEIGTQDVILPADWENEADPLRYITQRFTRAIETFVRQEPSQYLWVHRRWKTRPKGEAPEQFD